MESPWEANLNSILITTIWWYWFWKTVFRNAGGVPPHGCILDRRVRSICLDDSEIRNEQQLRCKLHFTPEQMKKLRPGIHPVRCSSLSLLVKLVRANKNRKPRNHQQPDNPVLPVTLNFACCIEIFVRVIWKTLVRAIIFSDLVLWDVNMFYRTCYDCFRDGFKGGRNWDLNGGKVWITGLFSGSYEFILLSNYNLPGKYWVLAKGTGYVPDKIPKDLTTRG